MSKQSVLRARPLALLIGLVVVLAALLAPTTGRAATTPQYMQGTPLKIPYSATVLTLSGLNYNIYNDQPTKFQGVFNRAPYVMVKVQYPASLASDSITKGVEALDTALHAYPGPKIVLAQSQGAQVASRWLRVHGADADAPAADEVTFLLTGNPLRSNGGGGAIGKREVDGVIGQPTLTNTKWPIIDVARRYDGWADAPQDMTNELAVDNADEGKRSFHLGYASVDIRASTHTISQSGNTTYVLTKEDVPPKWLDRHDIPASVLAALRRHIERAYDRPANDPATVVPPINGSLWTAFLVGLGVDASPTPGQAEPAAPVVQAPAPQTPVQTPRPSTPAPTVPGKPTTPTKPSTEVAVDDVESPELTKVALASKLDQFVKRLRGNVRVTSSEAGLLTAALTVTVRVPAARAGGSARNVEVVVAQRNLAAIAAGTSLVELKGTLVQSLAFKRVMTTKGARVIRTDLSGVVRDGEKNRDRFDIRVQ